MHNAARQGEQQMTYRLGSLFLQLSPLRLLDANKRRLRISVNYLRMLAALIEDENHNLSRKELIKAGWGKQAADSGKVSANVVQAGMTKLRTLFEEDWIVAGVKNRHDSEATYLYIGPCEEYKEPLSAAAAPTEKSPTDALQTSSEMSSAKPESVAVDQPGDANEEMIFAIRRMRLFPKNYRYEPITKLFKCAERHELAGDVWGAVEMYEALACKLQQSDGSTLAKEMDRRASKCRSKAAEMKRAIGTPVEKLVISVGQELRANPKPQLQTPVAVIEHGNFVWDWVFSNDSTRLCICGPEEQLRVYTVPTCKLRTTFNHKGPVQHLVCHPKSDLIVSLAFDNCRPEARDRPSLLHVWDLRTQRQLDVKSHWNGAEGLVISPEGSWLISIGRMFYGQSILWRFASRKGTLESTSGFEYYGVINAAFSPTRELIALAKDDGTVRVLSLSSMREYARLEHNDEVIRVAFSQDGERIITGSKDFTACLWDAPSGHLLARFGPDLLNDVAFSPDGRWIATGADDFTCIWNAETGEETCRLCHDMPGALKLAYSPNGTCLATGHCDSTARIWHVPSGKEIARLPHAVYASEVAAIAFSSNGRFIATGGGRDGVALWPAPELPSCMRPAKQTL